jgi:hypothetical protein
VSRPADVLLATAAAVRLHTLRSDQWPSVAAHLIAEGFDGQAVVSLAVLQQPVTGWEIDELLPAALEEISLPDLSPEEAAAVLAPLLARRPGDLPGTRALARMASWHCYEPDILAMAYALIEWADYDGGPTGRVDAETFELMLRSLPAPEIPDELAGFLLVLA